MIIQVTRILTFILQIKRNVFDRSTYGAKYITHIHTRGCVGDGGLVADQNSTELRHWSTSIYDAVVQSEYLVRSCVELG